MTPEQLAASLIADVPRVRFGTIKDKPDCYMLGADYPHVTYWTVNNAARGKTFGG